MTSHSPLNTLSSSLTGQVVSVHTELDLSLNLRSSDTKTQEQILQACFIPLNKMFLYSQRSESVRDCFFPGQSRSQLLVTDSLDFIDTIYWFCSFSLILLGFHY